MDRRMKIQMGGWVDLGIDKYGHYKTRSQQ